jgi:post-segregation antitoxin (ccd killing protein)
MSRGFVNATNGGESDQVREGVKGNCDASASMFAAKERAEGCILRRMARIQVYLPDDLYKQVKTRGLPASELLQKAVRVELRRLELLAETDRYVADLVAEVGPPTAAQRTRATTVARRLAQRSTRQAG